MVSINKVTYAPSFGLIDTSVLVSVYVLLGRETQVYLTDVRHTFKFSKKLFSEFSFLPLFFTKKFFNISQKILQRFVVRIPLTIRDVFSHLKNILPDID